ncbi:MAG TPA: hypothetical protein VGJ00_10365 [Rhabdochlamydiaceae bacterium]|jgi:hypothetical protein
MATEEMFTSLPSVSNAMMSDIICAVQGYVSPSNLGLSVQETLQQVYNLFQSNIILFYPGNPNGNVAGTTYQFCWDTVDMVLYICTTTGTASTAVWTAVSSGSGVITPAHGGTGVASPTAHTLPVAEGSSNFNFLGPLTNGQLLIGSTGLDPVPAVLAVSGTGLSITNAPGSITINSTGLAGFSWTVVSGTSQAMLSGNGYISNNAGLVTLTLPATSAVGDEIDIIGKGAGGWLVQCGAGQTIVVGSSTTSIAGSVASTNRRDSFYMICTVANLEWTVGSAPQSSGLTIV